MDNNHFSTDSTDQSAVYDPSLSLPHFDEDATLLSARPVVPLHEVNAETRSRRRVNFGLTILAAVLLGALGATLLLMQRGQNWQSAREIEVSQPTGSPSGAAGGTSSESAESSVAVSAEPDEELERREVPRLSNYSHKKQPTAPLSRRSLKPTRVPSSNDVGDEDSQPDDRELRRYERREARRELRRRREQMTDDLLRIREIFEGSPRP